MHKNHDTVFDSASLGHVTRVAATWGKGGPGQGGGEGRKSPRSYTREAFPAEPPEGKRVHGMMMFLSTSTTPGRRCHEDTGEKVVIPTRTFRRLE